MLFTTIAPHHFSFDCRLIVVVINALLIYNLIAAEILNIKTKTLVVVGANEVSEFDKSATMHTTAAKILRQAYEKQKCKKGHARDVTTTTTTTNNVDEPSREAELAYFGVEDWSSVVGSECDDNNFGHNNKNNKENKNNNHQYFRFALASKRKQKKKQSFATNKISFPFAPRNDRDDNTTVVVVADVALTAEEGPFAVMTENCSHFTSNNSNNNIMPTINLRAYNFQNDKKQIASVKVKATKTTTTTTTTAKRNINADVREMTFTRTHKTKETTTAIAVRNVNGIEMTAILESPTTIKPNVITAKKSTTATPTTTKIAADSSLISSGSTSVMGALDGITTAAQTTKTPSTYAAIVRRRSTRSARADPSALLWWPSLRRHDLLSSTNAMPKCQRAATTTTVKCVNVVWKCQAAVNRRKTTTTTTIKAATKQTAVPLPFMESSRVIRSTKDAPTESSSPSPSSSSAPATTTLVLSGKVTMASVPTTKLTTTTTKNGNRQSSWSRENAKNSDGQKQVKAAAMANIKISENVSPTNNNNNNQHSMYSVGGNTTKTNSITTTTNTMTAATEVHETRRTFATAAAAAMPTNATRKTTTTAAAASVAANSTGSLQSHWQRILSRRKRYLSFPEGSSFTVSLCITVGILGNPRYDYMSFGLNWGLSYDLPNTTWVLNQLHGLSRHPTPPIVLHRRNKRVLYEQIGAAVENMGYNGRDCVLRALCESRQYFARHKMGMIGEMLRVIFSLPKQRLYTRELRESADIAAYDHAYRRAHATDCATQYDCSFSLLELAFGKYARPPATDYYYFNKFGM